LQANKTSSPIHHPRTVDEDDLIAYQESEQSTCKTAIASLQRMPHSAVSYAQALIRRPSITPLDEGCQELIQEWLKPMGFQRTQVNQGGVRNSLYQRTGERSGTLAFAGHTDVVPTGPLEDWLYDPFAAELDTHGILHGRGTQDMKGAIACFIAAIEISLEQGKPLPNLQLLITSDEEGESIDGTIRLMEYLQAQQCLPDIALVGEPSSLHQVGDIIRRGRRGVVQANITFKGKQGHSAYPKDADNAIHHAMPALDRIANIDWGEPCAGFPATSCQITNIQAGTGASNVIPGQCQALIDIRYNPNNDYDEICAQLHRACEAHAITADIQHTANAFVTPDGPALDAICHSITQITGLQAIKDTGGGTSDARFLALAKIPVIELGLTNSSIHQVNEQVAVHELATLTKIYTHFIQEQPTWL